MLLRHNSFRIWANGDEMIIAKFWILGEVDKGNGKTILLSQTDFWDTSRNHDPTIKVLLGVQFQFIGIEPEELLACTVDVSTCNGPSVGLYQDRRDKDGYRIYEYVSRYPLMITVENNLTNCRTVFQTRWDRKPHKTLTDEFIFYLHVGKREEPIKDARVQVVPAQQKLSHDDELSQEEKDAIAEAQVHERKPDERRSKNRRTTERSEIRAAN